MFEQYDDLMTVDDVMEALNIGRSKVYELLKNKKNKSFKMKRYLIPKAALVNFVSSQAKMNLDCDYKIFKGTSSDKHRRSLIYFE